MMALILVDEEDIAALYAVGAVVDQKLFSAADGVINFITVMDVHVHGLVIVVQMRHRKILLGDARVYGCFAGTVFFHGTCPFLSAESSGRMRALGSGGSQAARKVQNFPVFQNEMPENQGKL